MKTILSHFRLLSRITILAGFCLLAVIHAEAQPNGKLKLDFRKPVLESGTAGADNAVYRFPAISSKHDALVKIVGRSNSKVKLVNIDLATTGYDKAWQPEVGYDKGNAPNAMEWWMEFQVQFVDKKTTKVSSVEDFEITAVDVDGNGGKIREYVNFYNLNSYRVENNSILTMLNLTQLINGINKTVGVRVDGPMKNFAAIDTSGTAVMATATYLSKNSFNIRTGSVATGQSGGANRMYSFYGEQTTYNNPNDVTLPVKLRSFEVRKGNDGAELQWVTSEEIGFSHFVVERSSDGKYFNEVSNVYSNAHSMVNEYHFQDQHTAAGGNIYYRLKMVDRDGQFAYSAVRILKFGANAEAVQIAAYPNPAISDIRINIPEHWQQQQVRMDMVSLNGVVVMRKTNPNAGQQETLHISNLQPGIYLIRVTSGNESALKQIVKK